nr:microsomal glutathione S-transferase 1 isoform X1 [Mirounga angustirostris]
MVDLTELMENEVFMAYASYTTIILSKMMFMSTATAFYRLTRKVFANPEDCAGFGKGENAKKYLRTDDRVERVRSSWQPPFYCFFFRLKSVLSNLFLSVYPNGRD